MLDTVAGIIAAIIMMLPVIGVGILIYVLYNKYRKEHPKVEKPKKDKKQEVKPKAKEVQAKNEPVSIENGRSYRYHIVGTNYPNDRGEDVGEILNDILVKHEVDPGDELLVPGDISATTFEGEKALKVCIGGKHIGWIKRTDIDTVMDMLIKHPCNVQIKLNQKRVVLANGDDEHVMGGDVFADAIISYEVLSGNGVDK